MKLSQSVKTSSIKYDIIILTETWLHEGILDSELDLDDFTIYRRDRTSASRGGGVLIAVNNTFFSQECLIHETLVEQVFVSIKCGSKKYLIGSVYIPPKSATHIYLDHTHTIENLMLHHQDHVPAIFGDFNLPHIYWSNDDLGPIFETDHRTTTFICDASRILTDSYTSLGLLQYNNICNPTGYFLDLCFTSELIFKNLSQSLDSLLPCDIYHPALTLELNYNPDPFSNSSYLDFDNTYFNFNKANFEAISALLSNINWEQTFDNIDIQTATDRFYEIILSVIELYVPRINLKSNNYPKWFSRELVTLIKAKKDAHKQLKQLNLPTLTHNYEIFARLRAQCKKLSSQCYTSYLNKLENEIPINVKKFWSFINEKRKSKGIPAQLFLDDKVANTGTEIVNLFASFFKSTYSNTQTPTTLVQANSEPVLDSIYIPFNSIKKSLINLNVNKGSGPDNISPLLLKNCANEIVTPLYILFNKSLSEGKFPDRWKLTFITPIFKNGSKADIRNYRPISITSIIPKIFDRLVTEICTLKLSSQIVDNQHGFMCGKSTITNLITYEQFIINAMEHKWQVDAIYTDFSKAFDTVNHDLLLCKLHNMGVRGKILEWFRSYLVDRRQIVRFKNFHSEKILVSSGVPQGSHLGPLLFNIFINDIILLINNSNCLLFADDLKLFSIVKTHDDCIKVQQDLSALNCWCTDNGMRMNINKCHVISFTKSKSPILFNYCLLDTPLSRVEVIKDLGVLFDCKLTFVPHINHIYKKSLHMLGFIIRNTREFKDVRTFRSLYLSLVRPILLYASPIWTPNYNVHITKLEKVQHRFFRYAAFKQFNPMSFNDHDYSYIASSLEIPTLYSFRQYNDALFLYKILNGKTILPDLHNILPLRSSSLNLRSISLYRAPNYISNLGLYSPTARFCRTFESLSLLLNLYNPAINEICTRLKTLILRYV